MEKKMARITSFIAAATLALTASVAFAGGPNDETNSEDDVIVVAQGCASSVSLCPAGVAVGSLGGGAAAAALGAAVLLGAALSSGSH
jgi:hypothetical protein